MRFIAIIVTACFIDDKDSGSRDFSVIEISAKDKNEVIDKIFRQKPSRYKNYKNGIVKWKLVDIFSIEKLGSKNNDLSELAGFVTDKSELFGKLSLVKSSKVKLKNRYKS
jgi:hypothetical protein